MRGDSAWSVVISDVSAMKMSGAMNATAVAISRLCSATPIRNRRRRTARGTTRRAGGVAATGSAGVVVLTSRPSARVVDPAARVTHDHERDRERDDEQQHRHRRRVAHVEEAEALLEQQHWIEQ